MEEIKGKLNINNLRLIPGAVSRGQNEILGEYEIAAGEVIITGVLMKNMYM